MFSLMQSRTIMACWELLIESNIWPEREKAFFQGFSSSKKDLKQKHYDSRMRKQKASFKKISWYESTKAEGAGRGKSKNVLENTKTDINNKLGWHEEGDKLTTKREKHWLNYAWERKQMRNRWNSSSIKEGRRANKGRREHTKELCEKLTISDRKLIRMVWHLYRL